MDPFKQMLNSKLEFKASLIKILIFDLSHDLKVEILMTKFKNDGSFMRNYFESSVLLQSKVMCKFIKRNALRMN